MNIEGIQLQEELPQKGINISFLDIASLAIILGIKHYIVELMERTIIKVFKDMVIRTTRIIIIKGIETIIHFLVTPPFRAGQALLRGITISYLILYIRHAFKQMKHI
jgi:hypothetical protein